MGSPWKGFELGEGRGLKVLRKVVLYRPILMLMIYRSLLAVSGIFN